MVGALASLNKVAGEQVDGAKAPVAEEGHGDEHAQRLVGLVAHEAGACV